MPGAGPEVLAHCVGTRFSALRPLLTCVVHPTKQLALSTLSPRTRLRHQRALHEPGKHRGTIRNCLVIEVVAVVVHGRTRLAVAKVDVGTWDLLQHEGEILRSRGWDLVAVDVCLTDELGRSIGDGARRTGRIDEGGEDQPVIDFRLRPKRLCYPDSDRFNAASMVLSISRFIARTVP